MPTYVDLARFLPLLRDAIVCGYSSPDTVDSGEFTLLHTATPAQTGVRKCSKRLASDLRRKDEQSLSRTRSGGGSDIKLRGACVGC